MILRLDWEVWDGGSEVEPVDWPSRRTGSDVEVDGMRSAGWDLLVLAFVMSADESLRFASVILVLCSVTGVSVGLLFVVPLSVSFFVSVTLF